MRLLALLVVVGGLGVVSGSDGYKHRRCRKVGHTNMEGSEEGANVSIRSTPTAITTTTSSSKKHGRCQQPGTDTRACCLPCLFFVVFSLPAAYSVSLSVCTSPHLVSALGDCWCWCCWCCWCWC
eukprot:COSAG02_NODE_1051_length_14956_cov_3.414216_4_plen_124_part_00